MNPSLFVFISESPILSRRVKMGASRIMIQAEGLENQGRMGKSIESFP